MSSTLQLNESTLTVDANENEIALSWTPEKLTFPGSQFTNRLKGDSLVKGLKPSRTDRCHSLPI